MPTVEKQTIRAEVRLGSGIIVRTPNVMSFNIRKARGQMAATFSASLKVSHDEFAGSSILLSDNITIKAGTGTSFDGLPVLFTGKIYRCVINPVRTDASKVVLNISGKDVMAVMEGQKVNRRVKTYRDGSVPPQRWGVVNNIIKHNTPRRQTFPKRVYTSEPVTGVDIPRMEKNITPEAFQFNNELYRSRTDSPTGSLALEKVVTE